MNESPFADRLNSDSYADDPLVGVFAYDFTDPTEIWVPERLWARLVAIGAAYQLHYLPLLDGSPESRTLDATQANALVEELDFIRSLTVDPLLESTAAEVLALVVRASRSGSRPALRIEGQ
jgi:hypothetical protein